VRRVGEDAGLGAGVADGIDADAVQRHRRERMVSCSPMASSWSISRSLGFAHTASARAINSLVTPERADTTRPAGGLRRETT